MKTIDIIRRAGRSLRQAKTRTLLTSLAIGVGAFTITLSLAGGQGGREYADAIVKSNTDVREIVLTKEVEDAQAVQEYDPSSTATTQGVPGLSSSSPLETMTTEELDAVAEYDHVDQVTPSYFASVNYITREGQKEYVVSSLTPYSPAVTLEFAAGGSDSNLADDEIILNEDYVEALGFSSADEAIGETVTINATRLATVQESIFTGGVPESDDFEFTVVGVSSESGLAFRSQGSLLISQDASKTLYDYVFEDTPGYEEFVIASVIVDDGENAEAVAAELEENGYAAETAEDLLGLVNTFINVLLGILLGFGALAVLTSVFGIINTQYISVLERTQQIGLMKALGMSGADVGKLFTFEAAWIGFLGGAIGAGLAVLAGSIANPYISEALGLGDIYLLVFVPWQVIAMVVTLIVIAILAGIFPARKAARLDPIEALRTE